MTLLFGDGWEMSEQLETGQVAICVRCDEYWLDRADLRLLGEAGQTPVCEWCGVGGFKPGYLGRRDQERSLEQRWDREVLAIGWTAMPDLLVDNLQTLGLNESHYFLLCLLETYRRRGREPVWPKIDTLTARTPGWSRSKVERLLRDLRRLGLIEAEPTRRYGRQAENRFTRNGLDVALRCIANRTSPVKDSGAPDDTSCTVSPSLVKDQPVNSDVDATSPVTWQEAEVVEADAEEADAVHTARAPLANVGGVDWQRLLGRQSNSDSSST